MSATFSTELSVLQGTQYDYSIVPSNIYGAFAGTSDVNSVTTASLPTSPTDVTLNIDTDKTKVDIAFTVVASVTYTVQFQTSSSTYSSFSGVCDAVTSSPCTVSNIDLRALTGMSLGSDIQVKVFASNSYGSSTSSGPYSNTTVVVYMDKPTSIIIPSAASTQSDTSVQITWTPISTSSRTAANGYDLNTISYIIQYRDAAGSGSWLNSSA